MNPWQLERQIAFTLKAALWPDSPNAKVLGDAVVSSMSPETFYRDKTIPYAVVKHTDAEFDSPFALARFKVVRFEIAVATQGFTDRQGQSAVLGGNLQSIGRSQGRGADEIAQQVQVALNKLDFNNGIATVGVTVGTTEVKTFPSFGIVVTTIKFEVYGAMRDRFYFAPYRFLCTSGGVGVINMSWQNPATRFDSYGLVARYAANTAPTTPTGGLAVPGFAASGYPTSFSFTPGAGTWGVSLFNALDEVNQPPSSPQRNSSPASFTITV